MDDEDNTLDSDLEFIAQDTEVLREDDDDLPTLQEGALPVLEDLDPTTKTVITKR